MYFSYNTIFVMFFFKKFYNTFQFPLGSTLAYPDQTPCPDQRSTYLDLVFVYHGLTTNVCRQ